MPPIFPLVIQITFMVNPNTVVIYGKKINAKYPDKCQPKVRRRKKMEDLIDEVFAV